MDIEEFGPGLISISPARSRRRKMTDVGLRQQVMKKVGDGRLR